jgi:hypothetical protein
VVNKKTALIVGSMLAVVLCCVITAGVGIYSFLNNPEIKKGLEVAGEEMGAMLDLRQKMLQEYSCEDVGIQIMNGSSLNVSLINSEFNDLPNSEQADSAIEVAQFVKDNYTGKAALTRIVIIFVKNNRVGPLNTNQTISFPFGLSELQ